MSTLNNDLLIDSLRQEIADTKHVEAISNFTSSAHSATYALALTKHEGGLIVYLMKVYADGHTPVKYLLQETVGKENAIHFMNSIQTELSLKRSQLNEKTMIFEIS